MLGAISKKVIAIEEVKKYADMVNFLSRSFGVQDKIDALPISLYKCTTKEFYSNFDIVYFPGVIYHLSDPVLAFRILFNSLRIGEKSLLNQLVLEQQNLYVFLREVVFIIQMQQELQS